MRATKHVVGAITIKPGTLIKKFITRTTEETPLITDMDNPEFNHLEEQKQQLLKEIILHLENKDGINPQLLQVFLRLVSLKKSMDDLQAYLEAYSSPYEQ